VPTTITQPPLPCVLFAGVDEAGRGAWSGPVIAAAVILDAKKPIEGLADSKKLSALKREFLAHVIKERALAWSIGAATVDEIDRLNILQATFLAMQRAVLSLTLTPENVLIDGNSTPKLPMPTQSIIRGDSKIPAISAASILAKVERDLIMVCHHHDYPHYAFHRHKGYGTAKHSTELAQFGVLDIHRKSFAPIKKLCGPRRPC